MQEKFENLGGRWSGQVNTRKITHTLADELGSDRGSPLYKELGPAPGPRYRPLRVRPRPRPAHRCLPRAGRLCGPIVTYLAAPHHLVSLTVLTSPNFYALFLTAPRRFRQLLFLRVYLFILKFPLFFTFNF